MYSGIKKVNRSKGYFLDALKAVRSGGDSQYFKEGLELVGVNLDSDFLKISQVIADPYLSVNLADDVGITIDIRLKPESVNDPILDILDLVMESTNTGMFQGFRELDSEEPLKKDEVSKLSNMLMPKEATESNEDPIVTLFFSEDSVELQRFKLLGEDYYAFSLTEEAILDSDVYKHTLNILFKDRSSSFETFFSAFVGEQLGKRETHRILESVSQNNITGFFIGGASLRSPNVKTLTYALTNTGMVYEPNEELLTLRTEDTSYVVELKNLRDTEVRVNEVGKYTLALKFSGGVTLDIYIG